MQLMATVPIAAVLSLLAATAPSACASDGPDHAEKEKLFLRNSAPSRNAGIVSGLGGGRVKVPTPGNDNDVIKERLDRRQKVLDFWTPERIRNAKPRHRTHDINDDTNQGSKWGDKKIMKDKNRGGQNRTLQETVVNERWESRGEILRSAGRLLFRMEEEYLCSATVVLDDTLSTPDHSVLITAAHCVYDDINKVVS